MPLKSKQQAAPQTPAQDTNAVIAVDIREAKPPLPLDSNWLWFGVLIAGALFAALAAFFWFRSRRRATQQPEVQIPPHIVARDRLRAALALITQPGPFCVEVSQIIRVYLEQQFKLHAPERTTEEFLAELQDSSLLGLDQKRTLADFLMRCDLVKFARYEPGEPELRSLYDAAVRLVEETQWAASVPNTPLSGEQAPAETRPALETVDRKS
ncbi:MAG: hypothetical protein QHJ82_01190 [Verrucomicrobiota bacterium]|nr:hypothetical protein [Verrucomicrobiota bacterium]